MPIGLEVTASQIATFLINIAGPISLILIVLGGIVYGLSFTQPADSRGKWQNSGLGLIVGGVIVFAIAMGATVIQETAGGLLT